MNADINPLEMKTEAVSGGVTRVTSHYVIKPFAKQMQEQAKLGFPSGDKLSFI